MSAFWVSLTNSLGIVFAALRMLALYGMSRPVFATIFALGLLGPGVQIVSLSQTNRTRSAKMDYSSYCPLRILIRSLSCRPLHRLISLAQSTVFAHGRVR